MSGQEFNFWMGYFKVKREEEEKAQKKKQPRSSGDTKPMMGQS